MEIQAPSHWRNVDFISDLHLQASEMKTFYAWQHFLTTTTADAVFMLGDLFEVWVGDDALEEAASFEQRCAHTLRDASDRLALYILHGNRDFLLGKGFMQAAGATLIADPTVLTFAGQRWVLSHGDALCLDDTAYLSFRQKVRSESWQSEFLKQSLSERRALARNMRAQSAQHQARVAPNTEVDHQAANQLLIASQADTLIHGHTHKPHHHRLGSARSRWVLSDWDFDQALPRGDVLRISSTSAPIVRLDPITLLPKNPG